MLRHASLEKVLSEKKRLNSPKGCQVFCTTEVALREVTINARRAKKQIVTITQSKIRAEK